MTNDTTERLAALVSSLLEVESSEVPLLTATVDLRVGSAGQPPSQRLLVQAARQAGDAIGDVPLAVTRSFEADIDAFEDAMEQASGDGSLGLVYIGANAADILYVLETPYPLRNSVHVGSRPWLFELDRMRYLAGRSICLVTTDLSTMHITRVRYGAGEANESVEWSNHYLRKHRGRTAIEGAGASMPGAGGHSMNRVERYVEQQRELFAAEAAEQIASFMDEDDLLVVAGPEEARARLLNSLPEEYSDTAIESANLDPTQPERELLTSLTDLVVEVQYQNAAGEAVIWFDGANQSRAIGGIEENLRAATQGRLGTLVLHEDAVDHYGNYEDARYQEAPGDPAAIEALLQAAMRQSADVMYTDEHRVLEEQQGAIGVARFEL